ncbi:MAG: hypothetical protein Q7J35_03590 [Candidatus Methanoperedens sp.]|nr:hypothetical protein [Candidatus Methanoperedens sp.]
MLLSKLSIIEIKEWDKRVNPKIAVEFLETYKPTCEYFYLAAKKFSKSTLELENIGLFDLTKMKVIKNPEYLYPDTDQFHLTFLSAIYLHLRGSL